MRKTNNVYLVTWRNLDSVLSTCDGYHRTRVYVDTRAEAKKAVKDQFGADLTICRIDKLWPNDTNNCKMYGFHRYI